MNRLLGSFLIRWLTCSLGLWLAAALLSGSVSYGNRLRAMLSAGFILAVINMIIKPLVVLLSLPAVILTLGLFMVVINGLMVLLAATLYAPLQVGNLWAAMVTGIIIGLVNLAVTAIL